MKILIVMCLLLTGCAQTCGGQNMTECNHMCGLNGVASFDANTVGCTCGHQCGGVEKK